MTQASLCIHVTDFKETREEGAHIELSFRCWKIYRMVTDAHVSTMCLSSDPLHTPAKYLKLLVILGTHPPLRVFRSSKCVIQRISGVNSLANLYPSRQALVSCGLPEWKQSFSSSRLLCCQALSPAEDKPDSGVGVGAGSDWTEPVRSPELISWNTAGLWIVNNKADHFKAFCPRLVFLVKCCRNQWDLLQFQEKHTINITNLDGWLQYIS